jgi:putative transposase
VAIVSESREEHGLNKCLRTIGLAKSTFYYRQNEYQHENPEDERLKEEIIDIIAEHPNYGWRRILPDLREAAGEPVNHKRLKHLLREYDLGLARQVQENKPSPLREIVREAGGSVDLVNGRSWNALQVLSTDFTELSYANGYKKAYLMAMVDIESRVVFGWALGKSPNRELALTCWDKTTARLDAIGENPEGMIVHHDQDTVYTSYQWLDRLLLQNRAKVSCSTRGAKDNPWIESLWSRLKCEVGSQLQEAENIKKLNNVLEERMEYYNTVRRHSSTLNIPPARYLEHSLNRDDIVSCLSRN